MTRFSIDQTHDGLAIRVTEMGAAAGRLLAAFQDCQDGRCDCPTDEYDKVSALTIESEPGDAVEMKLISKPGEHFDESEIEACLRHRVAKVED